ncbi:MAG: ABC transporter substrate-binding protein [Candidatus Heimdallarchaeaceae archaeon]
MKKKPIIFALFILSSLIVMSAFNTNTIAQREPIANLTFKTNGGGVRPDYGLYIAQYLRDIGIEVEVKVEEWVVFLGTLFLTHNYDLGVVTLGGGGATPGARDVWMEAGSLNIFGLGPDLPYGNQSEVMQDLSVTLVDPVERQALLYDWQNLMMDKIIPILPLYSSRSYVGLWANTLGYESRWGLADSLPYMSYAGYHDGQDSLDEFNLADANWKELNPLFTDDTSSSFITGLMMEPIVQMNPDYAPLKTGLVYDWDQIDETHYQFWMMDDIFWNPSYNSTDRDANSDPLTEIPTGELMLGLKNGEYSDGSNQQVTAKDAVFTYVAWANDVVSESTSYQEWISDIYVDPVDELSFHIHIDGDPDTVAIEPFADMWAMLPWEVLPEFFLNSTDPTVTYTEGGVETTGLYANIILTDQWIAFSTSAFGCGKFSLDYSIKNSVTVMERYDGWYGKGAIDGTTGMTPFVKNINVRVIPDTSAELAEFKAGKLDLAGLGEFPAERKQMQADAKFQVQTFVGASLTFMFYNLRRPFIGGVDNFVYLDEPGKEEYTVGVAVRKAINYAINRDEINAVIHDGEYQVAHSVVYPSQAYYYYNDIVKYNYDVDASFEWLEAAGYDIPEGTPFPVFGLIAALGAAAFIAYYRKRK